MDFLISAKLEYNDMMMSGCAVMNVREWDTLSHQLAMLEKNDIDVFVAIDGHRFQTYTAATLKRALRSEPLDWAAAESFRKYGVNCSLIWQLRDSVDNAYDGLMAGREEY